MSESARSHITMVDSSDPEMRSAVEQARATFRYFWREIAWERRRIVPALDLACVKAPFSDGDDAKRAKGQPDVEEMWLGDIDFDGLLISGALLNAPDWLKSIKKGDTARLRPREISDWMYVVEGQAYGAHTVQVIRARMSTRERKEHDNAWGLDFGDPRKVRLVPQKTKWFGKGNAELDEHPMSVAMAAKLEETLAKNPSMLSEKDHKGWTLLHHDALAGSLATVEVLLSRGADPNVLAANGATPLRLAKALGWDEVAALLLRSGAVK